MDQSDERQLRRAIELAVAARAAGDMPYGSLLVGPRGEVLAEDRNTVVTERDITGHPELKLARWTGRDRPFRPGPGRVCPLGSAAAGAHAARRRGARCDRGPLRGPCAAPGGLRADRRLLRLTETVHDDALSHHSTGRHHRRPGRHPGNNP